MGTKPVDREQITNESLVYCHIRGLANRGAPMDDDKTMATALNLSASCIAHCLMRLRKSGRIRVEATKHGFHGQRRAYVSAIGAWTQWSIKREATALMLNNAGAPKDNGVRWSLDDEQTFRTLIGPRRFADVTRATLAAERLNRKPRTAPMTHSGVGCSAGWAAHAS